MTTKSQKKSLLSLSISNLVVGLFVVAAAFLFNPVVAKAESLNDNLEESTTTIELLNSTEANFDLHYGKLGNGNGSITINPNDYICQVDCTQSYSAGTEVTITAQANEGSVFEGWSGACSGLGSCTVQMSEASQVFATFSLNSALVGSNLLTVLRDGLGLGSVISSPEGINCGVDCQKEYASGTPVTLTAQANEGSIFTGWSGEECEGAAGSCEILLDHGKTVTANFSLTSTSTPTTTSLYLLNVAKTGVGTGTVISNPEGISCGADCSEEYLEGMAVTLTAQADEGSIFTGWSGACSGFGACTLLVNDNLSVTANFIKKSATPVKYHLKLTKQGKGKGMVSSVPEGLICGGNCQEQTQEFEEGTTVTLTSQADEGSIFAGWQDGDCDGQTGNCNILILQDATATAMFDLVSTSTPTTTLYLLTVTKTGNGTGLVISNPEGISCGADCSEEYLEGMAVTLTAQADEDSYFDSWSGACSGSGSCSIALDQAKNVTAKFLKKSTPGVNYYKLKVTKTGSGTGTVVSSPEGIACGANCEKSFSEGTIVTLTAQADENSAFTGWSGACSGTANCSMVLAADATATANFILNTSTINFNLTVNKEGTGAGTVASDLSGISCGGNCLATYASGTTVVLTAQADSDSTFDGWSGACSGSGTCTVKMTNDLSVIAKFTKKSSPPPPVICVGCGPGPNLNLYIYNEKISSDNDSCKVIVTWQTNLAATSRVVYGSISKNSLGDDANYGYGLSTGEVADLTTMHSMEIVLNSCSGTYYFRPISTKIGEKAHGIELSATFSKIINPPVEPPINPPSVPTSTPTTTPPIIPKPIPPEVKGEIEIATTTVPVVANACECSPCAALAPIIAQNCQVFIWLLLLLNLILTILLWYKFIEDKRFLVRYFWPIHLLLTWVPVIIWYPACWLVIWLDLVLLIGLLFLGLVKVVRDQIKDKYKLSINLAGSGSGRVYSSPIGINCGLYCSTEYPAGTIVILTAEADSGSVFKGWSGGCCLGAGTCIVSVDKELVVTALFEKTYNELDLIYSIESAEDVYKEQLKD